MWLGFNIGPDIIGYVSDRITVKFYFQVEFRNKEIEDVKFV